MTVVFRYVKSGKLFRGRVDFQSTAGPLLVQIGSQERGVGGGLSPDEYSVTGAPLGRVVETVQITGAADNEFYSVRLKLSTLSVNSGGGATVGSIRNLLRDAVGNSGLGIAVADNGADAFDVTADVAGDALNLSVTAETPANITLSAQSVLGPASQILVAEKRSGAIQLRSTAVITSSTELLISG